MGALSLQPSFKAASFAAAALAAHCALAADEAGRFAIKGTGAQDCAAFLSAWDGGSTDLALYAGWIDGYVTGLNQNAADVFDLTPWQNAQTMPGLMHGACRRLPGETRFLDAFDALARGLLPHALAAESPLEGARVADRVATIYRETLRAAQAALAETGFFDGEPDGVFGVATAEALRAFQTREGLEASGLPDQPTLFALLLRGRGAPARHPRRAAMRPSRARAPGSKASVAPPRTAGSSAPAISLPSSTPHWSKGFTPQTAACTNTLCS